MRAGGPLAHLLAVPQDGGDDSEGDPLRLLKADIKTARGRALLVETVAAAWGDGRSAAPQRDWRPERLGPMPPDSMEKIREGAFNAVLAACGTPAGAVRRCRRYEPAGILPAVSDDRGAAAVAPAGAGAQPTSSTRRK